MGTHEEPSPSCVMKREIDQNFEWESNEKFIHDEFITEQLGSGSIVIKKKGICI